MLCWFFFLPVFCLKFALLLHALFDKIFKLSRGSALKGKGTPFKGQGTQMGVKGIPLERRGSLLEGKDTPSFGRSGYPMECKGTPLDGTRERALHWWVKIPCGKVSNKGTQFEDKNRYMYMFC